MPRRLLGTLTGAAVHAVRHPVASGGYVAGLAKGLAAAVVTGARPEEDHERGGRATAPPVEPAPRPTPTPTPAPGPEPSPRPAPPLPPDPMPDPVTPPPPGGETPSVEHEPTAVSRASAHGGPGSDEEVDAWTADATEPDRDVPTPVGTTGAGVATNPDTTDHDLQQPGTEPLMDPATTKAVRSEAQILGKGADADKG